MMKNNLIKKTIVSLTLATLWTSPLLTLAQKSVLDRTPPKMPEFDLSRGRGEAANPFEKLSPELRTLYAQFTTVTRGGSGDDSGISGFTAGQLKDLFGINDNSPNPSITVSIKFSSTAEPETVKKAGASIIFKTDKTVYAIIPVSNLSKLVNLESVQNIGVFKAMQVPGKPKESLPPQLTSFERGGSNPASTVKTPLANEFNKQGLTGKGVIIGVIDSGIDWKHPDFIRPDGTTRILALWDLSDGSFQKSGGSIG